MGKDTLSPLDKLFVVHIKQGRDKDTKDTIRRWDAGGPLLPSLQTALANYPHQLVELEVNVCVLQLPDCGAAKAALKGLRCSLLACTVSQPAHCWVPAGCVTVQDQD